MQTRAAQKEPELKWSVNYPDDHMGSKSLGDQMEHHFEKQLHPDAA
jgi:hypothetical protein